MLRSLTHTAAQSAGVFEDARHAYLNEVLIRRVGCTAALAVVYGEVMRQLLTRGALSHAVRVECRDLSVLPTAEARFCIITIQASKLKRTGLEQAPKP
jgi:hypothetical protein